MAKQKYVTRTTPPGTAIYPALNEPDTKFNPDGAFKTDLALPSDDEATKKLKRDIEKVYDEVLDKAKKASRGKKVKTNDLPFYDELDEEGEPTGRTIFKFKRPAGGTRKDGSKWKVNIALFDKRNKTMNDPIWTGSKIQVNFFVKPYETPAVGVSNNISAVRVLDLVNGSNRSADSYGFGDPVDDDEDGEDNSSDDAEDEVDF